MLSRIINTQAYKPLGLVNEEDLYRIEGPTPNHLKIEAALSHLGGNEWAGFTFKARVLKALGYDIDQTVAVKDKISAYNQVAIALNELGPNASRRALLKKLGLSINEHRTTDQKSDFASFMG